MVRHSMTCLRQWSQLAWVGQDGRCRARGKRASAGPRPIGPPSSPPCTAFPAPWPTAWWPGSARRSGTCWTWAGPRARGRWPFSAPARHHGHDLRPARRHRAGPRAAGRQRVCRPGAARGRRFLHRRAARRGRSRLGQRDRPSALPRAQPGAVRQGLSRPCRPAGGSPFATS